MRSTNPIHTTLQAAGKGLFDVISVIRTTMIEEGAEIEEEEENYRQTH